MANDLDSGFMDKMRIAPISKPAILFGKLFSDAISTIIQVIIILLIGFALGVTIASGLSARWSANDSRLGRYVRNSLVRHLHFRRFDDQEQSDHSLSWRARSTE